RERMVQDDLQKACSVIGGGKPDADTLAEISKAARESIEYSEGGIKLGDWQKGYELAWSGFGFRVGHNFDNHETREPGGNCYNCHKLAPQREIASGTIGPRLTGFAKDRGTDEATVKYVYEMIYNPHAYFPCTYMPRFGYKKLLTQEQISHLMAYILDPESPVNQQSGTDHGPGRKAGAHAPAFFVRTAVPRRFPVVALSRSIRARRSPTPHRQYRSRGSGADALSRSSMPKSPATPRSAACPARRRRSRIRTLDPSRVFV